MNIKNNYTLRISATSACNLNCEYCNIRKINKINALKKKTLIEIIQAGYNAGIRKITWTGGEPTMRNDIVDLVKVAKKIGIEKQSMTTNGIMFHKIAKELQKGGLTKVNISLDTTDREIYKSICSFDGLDHVLKSIDIATKLFKYVKINCVITKNHFDNIKRMVDFIDKYNKKIAVRFLEIVPCGDKYEKNKNLFKDNFVPVNEILKELKKNGKLTPTSFEGDIPKSKYYNIEGKNGIYGINPNYSVNYVCDKQECTKIRVNPNGYISNCTIQLKYAHNFANKSFREKEEIMKRIVLEKGCRKYQGFRHKQKYYDFWRFGIIPESLKNEIIK